ncbi:MAG: DNA methyltransferase [Terracidiphilus sp.]
MLATIEHLPLQHTEMLAQIDEADQALMARFVPKIEINWDLDRSLVSFQANREEIGHRWCKYREGFSASLIRYVIDRVGIRDGKILDPFAGSGTTLIIAAELGLDAVGIELLPSGAEIIEVRNAVLNADRKILEKQIRTTIKERKWAQSGERQPFAHLRITTGAFSEENERQLERFLFDAAAEKNELLSRLLRFSAMCVLEEISFTRKDGQYLRWDHRSGRSRGEKIFDKGMILSFDEAICSKLTQIADDFDGNTGQQTLFPADFTTVKPGRIELKLGSCLDILPSMEPNSISGIITSPPYCNRYDYTRTYALELAMLGVGEQGVRTLRQTMLSCTVENKDKQDLRNKFGEAVFHAASEAVESQQMLGLLLHYLEACKNDETINNPGIVRMVKNYFFELSLLIFASASVLKKGAPFVMVNDNVRYQGAHVPVGLILSDFAEQAGYDVEAIWVLPRGKGNSSQQMGLHGRQEVRKCVYVWRKR